MTASLRGALLGLAIGDAPPDNIISHGMAAGRVTDDTDQAVILGELIVEGRGHVDPEAFARRLLAWEQRMIAAG
jgi:ADP-ribosylglycohydrolase